jgi:hypothetical protein
MLTSNTVFGRLLLLITTLAITACAAPRTTEEAQRNDRILSTGVGTVLGGLVGCGVGELVYKGGCAAGAAIGGGGGLVAGNIYGEETAKRRGEFAQEQGEIEAGIIAQEQRIRELSDQANRLEIESKNRTTKLVMLSKQADTKAKVAAQAKSMLVRVNAELAQAKAMRLEVEEHRKAIEARVAEMTQLDSAANQAEEAQGLRNEQANLILKRDQLLRVFNTLNGVEKTLIAQNAQLSSLAKS